MGVAKALPVGGGVNIGVGVGRVPRGVDVAVVADCEELNLGPVLGLEACWGCQHHVLRGDSPMAGGRRGGRPQVRGGGQIVRSAQQRGSGTGLYSRSATIWVMLTGMTAGWCGVVVMRGEEDEVRRLRRLRVKRSRRVHV
jgi:hypothetical protein